MIFLIGLTTRSSDMMEEYKNVRSTSKLKHIQVLNKEEDEGYFSKGSSISGASNSFFKSAPLTNKFEYEDPTWKIIAIGKRNPQKYEMINGLLGQKLVSCPTSYEESITDTKVSGVNVEVLDLVKIGSHFSVEKVSEKDTILYFLPKNGYKKKIQNIARYCNPSIWKRCVILVDFTDEMESLVEKIQQKRQDITELLLNANIPWAKRIELQIFPISKAMYRHLPGHKCWFSMVCCTVLETSSYNFPKLYIEKIFATRNESKCKEHSDEFYMRHIDLKARKRYTVREEIRKKANIIICHGAVTTRSTIHALIGALVISLPSFGVGAGAGLITGAAAIDGRKETGVDIAPIDGNTKKTTKVCMYIHTYLTIQQL